VLPPKGLTPESIDAIQKELLNLGHNAVQPHYHPLVAPYKVAGRTILVLWVPGGEVRPYKARVSVAKDSREWAYFIRKNSSTVRARGADERELLGLERFSMALRVVAAVAEPVGDVGLGDG
jgi:ATP-dependent DNA helicase RecG